MGNSKSINKLKACKYNQTELILFKIIRMKTNKISRFMASISSSWILFKTSRSILQKKRGTLGSFWRIIPISLTTSIIPTKAILSWGNNLRGWSWARMLFSGSRCSLVKFRTSPHSNNNLIFKSKNRIRAGYLRLVPS